MNSKLYGQVFQVPEHILEFLRNQPDIEGLKRNKNILETGTVTYQQLKRILHDLQKVNRVLEPQKYNYYGGDLMKGWGMSKLQMERGQIHNREESERIANDIAGLTGERRNPSHKRTRKNSLSPKISMNDVVKPKSNSEKWSGASLFSAKSTKLFEEINRIKELML